MSQAKLMSDPVRAYLKDIGRIPLLEHKDEILLGRQVQRLMDLEEKRKELEEETGHKIDDSELSQHFDYDYKAIRRELRAGKKAKDKMVTANLRLVVSIAKKYTKRNMELLDIIQEGTIGLIRGVEKFDPGRGYKFSTYAYWWIRQGITRAIAEKSRSIRLPIHVTENINKLKKAQHQLTQELGQLPDMFQLADHLQLTVDEIKDLMCKSRHPISLEVKIGENLDTSLLDLLEDEAQQPDRLLERTFIKESIKQHIGKLPDMQATVISLRYGIGDEVAEPLSMTAVGQILNMSRDRVRTLEHKAINGLLEYTSDVRNYI